MSWSNGDTYALQNVYEPRYGALTVFAHVFPHLDGWVWRLFNVGTIELVDAIPLQDRFHPTQQAARDACIAWVQGALMRGDLKDESDAQDSR